jgi:RHS repeat-associated protein
LQQRGYNDVVTSNSNSTADKFSYQGQELEEELGKNTYGYQWRDYDPAIGRFNKIDRFANKYDDLTPYHFSANNPIYYKEVRGDSINVAQQYQQQFTQVLNGIFGGNAGDFSFNNSNNLVFNGSVKDLTKAQKKVFKGGFGDLLNEETVTNVIFEASYIADEGNGTAVLNAQARQGEATISASESGDFSQNYVVIDPNVQRNQTVMEVTEEFFNRQVDPTRKIDAANPPYRAANIQTNPTLTTFHGFGHIINGGKSQDKVIDYENRALKAFNDVNGTNIPKRNQDENHHSTPQN